MRHSQRSLKSMLTLLRIYRALLSKNLIKHFGAGKGGEEELTAVIYSMATFFMSQETISEKKQSLMEKKDLISPLNFTRVVFGLPLHSSQKDHIKITY